MPKPIQDMTSWGATGEVPLDARSIPSTQSGPTTSVLTAGRSTLPPGDGWAASPGDIGRRVGETMWDMSVVCEAAEALSLQFDVLQPLFLAVHDIGGTTSRRLLAGVAAAMQLPVHTLTVRRQGYGNLLARLEFVELTSRGSAAQPTRCVRIYSTQTPDTEEGARKDVADVLLGRAALAVLIVDGAVSQAALAVALAGMQNAMNERAWTNRHMLLMPLRQIPGLKAQAAHLGREHGIEVQVSPAIVRPFDAWDFVRSRWNALAELGETTMMPLEDPTSPLGRAAHAARQSPEATAAAVEALRRKLLSQRDNHAEPSPSPADANIDAAAKTIASMSKRERPAAPERAPRPQPAPAAVMPAHEDAPTVPAHLMPPVFDAPAAPSSAAVSPGDATTRRIAALLAQCAGVAGMRSCAVVDLNTRRVVGEHAVADPNGFAGHGARLANSLRAAALGFQIPGRVPDAAMTFDEHHVLVRPVPGHDHLAFVAIIGREDANVVVVRLKLQRIEKAVFPEVDALSHGTAQG
jgi:hypothetical protein